MSTTDSAAPQGNLNFVLISVFIDMLGIGLIVPVLPVLVGEFTGTREGQAYWYGMMGAVFGLMQFLFMPMLGAISDRIGRRPVLLYSMAGMCINFLTTAWAPNLAWLFLGRVIGGMSSASMSVASAYASDISTPENRAKSFGKIGAAFGLGFICGPMLGGLLGTVDLHLPFYVAGALSAANFVYGYFVVPESLPASRRAPFTLSKLNPLAAIGKLARRTDIRGLIVTYTLVTLAAMMLQTTWVLYTTFRFNWTPGQNGAALFCVGLTAAVVQAGLLGILIKRFGEVRLSVLGLVSGAITYLLYGLATQGWMMYVLIVCNVLSFAIGPALQSIVSKSTPSNEQGELMGSLQSISSVGVIIMPLLGSAILGEVSHLASDDWRVGSTFYLCAIMQAVAILVARNYFRKHEVPA
ncbi:MULTISPECIES: TCR/Tet family MFS transporter [unclassified Duganella]|uniref:TCR/Tet family MFS transporter n=1 Tax=unclassified Duganella TaxID=2636909 RepID=UPI000881A055|nr:MULTISPECIES: TCR/Tet family MFS transporter [unclassified Duganella]SDF62721.1 MFS transporter, DHA1 family, tetracycline resistance protein [Duganella sp. OV458]SDI65711.1 MFS transporter, DHA1 family, tetracycline resistance protein [Duganella sp. OV510]